MYIATALLCLISFLPQTEKYHEQKLPLILKGETVIVKKSEAIRLYWESQDPYVKPAAEIALITAIEPQRFTRAERRCAVQKIKCWWCECEGGN